MVLLLTVMSLLAPAGMVPASGAAWQDSESGGVKIALTSVTPAVARPGDTVRITGRITNDGATTVPRQQVSLVRSSTPLGRREDVAAWAAGSDLATGATLTSTRLGKPLAPGASTDFQFTVDSVSAIADRTYGALPVSLQTADVALHTFIGYQVRKEYVPLDVAWLVPLTLDPSNAMFGPPGQDRLAAWTSATASTSRLSRIIDGTRDHDVTWAVDPTLINPPQAVADPGDGTGSGATTQSESASPSPTGSAPAEPTEASLRAALSERIRTTMSTRESILLPDSDADVSAVYGAPGTRSLLREQVRRAHAVADEVGSRADIAWPVTPPTTSSQRQRLAHLYPGRQPTGTVVPASTFPSTIFTPQAAEKAADGRRMLAYDDRLSGLVAQASSPSAAALAGQQLIADSVSLLDERPGTTRTVLIAPPRTLDPDAAGLSHLLDTASSLPWVRHATVDDLVAAASDAVPVRSVDPSSRPTPSETPSPIDRLSEHRSLLTASSASALQQDATDVTTMGLVRDDGEEFTATWTETARQLTSVRWRTARGAWSSTKSALDDTAASSSKALQVSSGAVNFFAESGRLQATVVNHLDVGVHDVTVQLVPENPRLRMRKQPHPVEIGPGSRSTVSAEVTALAAGQVPVTIRLLNDQGTQLGTSATLHVRVSPTGSWIYWVVGGLAAVLLMVGLWRTLRGGRRRPADPLPSEDATTDD